MLMLVVLTMYDDNYYDHEQDHNDDSDGRIGHNGECGDDHHNHRDTWDVFAPVVSYE